MPTNHDDDGKDKDEGEYEAETQMNTGPPNEAPSTQLRFIPERATGSCASR